MFREMRLKEQQLSQEETIAILEKMTNGTLAINGEEKYPYSVPISYVYKDGKIYFHGAVAGQKYDLLTADPHVCLSVIEFDDVQPEKFTTFYKSVIVYGDVTRFEASEDIRRIMGYFVDKYSTGLMENGMKYVKSQEGSFCVYELDIAHMTGKRSE